jgi:hypothetical protein
VRLAAGPRHRIVAELAVLVKQLLDLLKVFVSVLRELGRTAHNGLDLAVGEGKRQHGGQSFERRNRDHAAKCGRGPPRRSPILRLARRQEGLGRFITPMPFFA